MTTETMTIREMCDHFSVSPRTLRFYEAKELLFPQREGQKRLFTRSDRARMKLILRGKRFGFSLEELRQILELYHRPDGERLQLNRSLEVARRRMAEMTQERDELETRITELHEEILTAENRLKAVPTSNAA